MGSWSNQPPCWLEELSAEGEPPSIHTQRSGTYARSMASAPQRSVLQNCKLEQENATDIFRKKTSILKNLKLFKTIIFRARRLGQGAYNWSTKIFRNICKGDILWELFLFNLSILSSSLSSGNWVFQLKSFTKYI